MSAPLAGPVAIIGAGGLGGPAALALARAGVPLTLFDGDVVALHNLPRQLLFGEADLEAPKVERAAVRLRALVPGCAVRPIAATLGVDNFGLLAGHALWLDCTDTLAAKLFFSDAAVAARQPLVHAGAVRFGGQVLAVLPGAGPCLRCLIDEGGEAETCSSAGILGSVVGVLGAEMARLSLRLLSGETDLAGRLVTYDAWDGTLRTRRLPRRVDCLVCAQLPVTSEGWNRAPAPRVSSAISGLGL